MSQRARRPAVVAAEPDPFHRWLHHVAPSALIGKTTQTAGSCWT